MISDMAPIMSGVREADRAAARHVPVQLGRDLAVRVPRLRSDFLIKIVQDEGFDAYLRQARELFDQMEMRKPSSPRDHSGKQYLLARSFRGA